MVGEVIASWLANEVLSESFGETIRRLMERRARAAREILQDELSRAKINSADAMDKDEAAAMVFGYAEAAKQGAARRNLRMLAQIMAGLLSATPPIFANEFLRWSRILADLTHDEIIVLATMHEEFLKPPHDGAPTVNAWNIFGIIAQNLTEKRIIATGEELETILQGLVRTGLVIQQSGATGGAVVGGTIYVPSSRLTELVALIRMDEILSERGP
jgi:hypothetical protein